MNVGIRIVDKKTGLPVEILTKGGSIAVRNYLQAIAEGDVENHSSWSKLGVNTNLSTSMEDLWCVGGEYVFPTTGMQMELVSSDVNDIAGGTGIRSVRLFYLTPDFTEHYEDITLNGTNVVTTVATDIFRVNNMRTLTCGSAGSAVGNVDIRHLSDSPIYGRIEAGHNRLRQMIWTVPKNKVLYIYNVLLSCGSGTGNRYVRFLTKGTYDNLIGTITSFFQTYTEVTMQDTTVDVPLEMPTKFIAGTDIKVSAISPDGASAGSCVIRGWVETV